AGGVALGLLDAHGVHAEEPHLAGDVLGALLIGVHGFVSAGQLTRALVTAARRCGAQLVERSRVRKIASAGGDLMVETERGSLTGNAVVVAAGTWSGQILVEGVKSRVPVRPIRGQLL